MNSVIECDIKELISLNIEYMFHHSTGVTQNTMRMVTFTKLSKGRGRKSNGTCYQLGVAARGLDKPT